MKYVGLTTTNLNIRLNNHLSHIRAGKRSSICQHFQQHNISNLQIGILESRTGITSVELHILEAYWIYRMGTIHKGLNSRDETSLQLDPHILIANNQLASPILHRTSPRQNRTV